jgi:hypothetical protein
MSLLLVGFGNTTPKMESWEKLRGSGPVVEAKDG